jgi:hypothetical protein
MKRKKKMIDSFTLKLNNNQFSVSENNKLDGKRGRQGSGYTSSSRYPERYRKDLIKRGIYCPVINWTKKTTSSQKDYEGLEIQVSAPKLIYGTNLYDVALEDINKICSKLLIVLSDIGISTTESNLRQTVIRKFDFS